MFTDENTLRPVFMCLEIRGGKQWCSKPNLTWHKAGSTLTRDSFILTREISAFGKVRWSLGTLSPYGAPSPDVTSHVLLQEAVVIIFESLRTNQTLAHVPKYRIGTRVSMSLASLKKVVDRY